MTTAGAKPRIMLIHALRESLAPIHAAFKASWQEAEIHDLLDSSLSADLAAEQGVLKDTMVRRFQTLADYAAKVGPDGRAADGILFTCSAFGPAIDAARKDMKIPVLKPNEAAFEQAIRRGGKAALLVTFGPALKPMLDEFEEMKRQAGSDLVVEGRVIDGALAALQGGRPEEHDELAARTAAGLGDVDTIVLGQFSLARAAPAVRQKTSALVLTTPDTAVDAIKARVEGSPARH